MKEWQQMVKKALGERIKQKRLERGMSQGELGRRTLLCQPVISEAEQGKTCFTVPTLVKVAHALGLTLDELMPAINLDGYPEAFRE